MVPWVGLPCVLAVFPDHINLIFDKYFVKLCNIAIKRVFQCIYVCQLPRGEVISLGLQQLPSF